MPSDRVVRWKGAAFLASLKRTGSILDVRAELCSAATIQVPPFVEFGNRSIRLPISLSWAVFPKSHFASLDRLLRKWTSLSRRPRVVGPHARRGVGEWCQEERECLRHTRRSFR